jgi:hypothetical protein
VLRQTSLRTRPVSPELHEPVAGDAGAYRESGTTASSTSSASPQGPGEAAAQMRLRRASGADAEWLRSTVDRVSRPSGVRVGLDPTGLVALHRGRGS